MKRTCLDVLLVAVAISFLPACDAGPGGENAANPDGGPEGRTEVAFTPVDRSGVSGTVSADHGDDGATVRLDLEGLQPGSAYSAQINSGRCAAGGPVVVPLGDLTAESDGAGTLEREVANAELSPDEPAFVEVLDATEAAVACADLEGHDRPDQPLTDRGDTVPNAPR